MRQLMTWCGIVFILSGLLVTSGCATTGIFRSPAFAILRVPEILGESLAQAVICPAGATAETDENCSGDDKKVYW